MIQLFNTKGVAAGTYTTHRVTRTNARRAIMEWAARGVFDDGIMRDVMNILLGSSRQNVSIIPDEPEDGASGESQ